MAITPLPTPPSRSAPSTFSTLADAFLGALPTFVTEANAQAAALELNDTTDASASSATIGTGAKTFVVTAGKSFQPGMSLMIADAAAPSTNWMHGQVTSYSGTTLVMNITAIGGSGTKTAWIITFSAPTGLPTATAESDFIVSGGSPFAWVKKTLLEVKALIGLVPQATGFTLAGGTTSKTLTVDASVSTSALVSKDSPSFTGKFNWADASELTISSGEITVTQVIHLVDTEDDVATDDLVTINGGSAGGILIIRAAHTDRTVVIKSTGNINTGGADITLDDTSKYATFLYDNALSKWIVVGGGEVTFATAAEITAGLEPAKAIAPDQLALTKYNVDYATAAEITAGTEAAKVTAPDQLAASGIYKETNRLCNVGIAATVSSKALTIALKGENGNDPSASNIVSMAFRDETLTTGTPNIRTVTDALSVVLASGGTLGFTSAEAGRLYVWAIDNNGTVELALSRTADIFPESNLVSTTAIGSGSDSATVMYSTSSRTNLACRCIGYIEITTGVTAGEWDNAPTKIQIMGPGVKRTGDTIQTQTAIFQATQDIGNASAWTAVTSLSITLTPTSVCNKVSLHSVVHFGGGAANSVQTRFCVAGTAIAALLPASPGNRTAAHAVGYVSGAAQIEPVVADVLHSPASVSAQAYTVEARMLTNNGYINRSGADTDNSDHPRTISTFTAMEIMA